MVLQGIKYIRKYWHFSLIIVIIMVTFSYVFWKQNDYSSMIVPITIQENNQNYKIHGVIITHYQNPKKNFFLIKTHHHLEKKQVVMVYDKKSQKNYPVEIIGFFNGYYVAVLDEVNLNKKIFYYYGPTNYKNSMNLVTLYHDKPWFAFKDTIKNIMYNKKPLGLITFFLHHNKIAGLMVFDQKSQKIKAISIKTFINNIKDKPLIKCKALDLILFNTHSLKVMTTFNHKNLLGQLVKVDNQKVKSMDEIENILNNTEKKTLSVVIKNIDNIEKTVNVNIIDQWLTSMDGYSRYLYESKNYSYYFYQPMGIILKIHHDKQEIFIINTNKKLYKKIKNKDLLKIITINDKPIKNFHDFLSCTREKNLNIILKDLANQENINVNFIRSYTSFFVLENINNQSKTISKEDPSLYRNKQLVHKK